MALDYLVRTPGRPLHKIVTVTGCTFTVAPSNDHTDGTWDMYDLYNAEFGFATGDQKIWARVGSSIVQIYPASAASGVTQVNTAGLISGGPITTSGTITTSMATNKLVGRGTAGTGIMEEITLGTGLSLSGTTLNCTAGGDGYVFYVALTKGAPNDYTGTATDFTAYTTNAIYLFTFDVLPTAGTAIKVNLNGAGLVTLVSPGGGNLPANAISITGYPYEFAYNGTNFTPESKIKITGGGDALSSITAAIDTNSIDSTNYAQTWAWSTASTQTPFTWTANALSTGTLFTLSSTSTAGDTSKLLQLTRSGANAGSSKTNYGLYSAITNTGTSSTNVAAYLSASGGSNNYGLIVNSGRVGIGTTAPTYDLHLRVANSSVTPLASNGFLIENNNSDALILMLTNSGYGQSIAFAPGTSTYGGLINYNSLVTGAMVFRTNGTTTRTIIGSNGYLGIGNWSTDPTYNIDVKGNMMHFFDGSRDLYYGINTSPDYINLATQNGSSYFDWILRFSTYNVFKFSTTANFLIGNNLSVAASATNTIHVLNGTAPSGSVADSFQLYSQDQAAGQASPFFRTEDSGIFKIATAKVGWASSTNLYLTSNDTIVLKLKTDTTAEFVSDVTINGKLTVTGAIDPTHLYLDEQSGNPSSVANKGILYTKDVSGVTQLFYMASDGSVNQVTPTSGTGTVTSIATAGLISGGTITTTGTITTSMATGKLVGRSTAGTGVMEEITVGTGLSLSGGTLSATGGSGGAWTYISTGTASSSSTIDFTGLDSTYSCYKVIINCVIPQTNGAEFWMRIGTGGTPTYQSGASDYAWISNLMYATGTGTTVGTSNTADGDDSEISMCSGAPGNGTGSNLCGEITIYNPSQSSTYHNFDFKLTMRDAAGTPDQMIVTGSGSYKSTTAVTAVRFLFSSGNITSGTFKLYGIT